MPIYEFLCQKCGKGFVFSSSISEYERKRTEGFQCSEVAARRSCGRCRVFRSRPPRRAEER